MVSVKSEFGKEKLNLTAQKMKFTIKEFFSKCDHRSVNVFIVTLGQSNRMYNYDKQKNKQKYKITYALDTRD